MARPSPEAQIPALVRAVELAAAPQPERSAAAAEALVVLRGLARTVAARMAKGIVDTLKMIDIENDKSKTATLSLRALAYAGFLLNLINLVPLAILDGAHVLRSWRVLRAGGGRRNPSEARRLAVVVAVASLVTVAALVLGLVAAHVPQDRL